MNDLKISEMSNLELARNCVWQLKSASTKLVLAESCTCGLVAARLGSIPGVSEVFCGSMVTYQTESKTAWLDIDAEKLESEQFGPVSAWASHQLAQSALLRTPQSDVSVAVTGHLGPIDVSLDGLIYVCLIRRGGESNHAEHRLLSPSPTDASDSESRGIRQSEAARFVLEEIYRFT